jgi:type IV fimbrial biogenesis protein FimT
MLLNTPLSRNTSGFSLIELMIGIAIFGITMTYGISSFRVWTQNTQIRTAAESIQNGLQRARSEAVKNNANVFFRLDANSGWTVASGVAPAPTIDSRLGTEGSANVTRTVVPANATTVTYNNWGSLAPNADGSASLTTINLDSAVLTAADSRNLRITIGAMGNVKMCDPDPSRNGSVGGCQ